uniref:Translocon-associated protein subunit delta n=1 Tax=Panthera leo TaxID=9689 RepID=A0A8C8XGN0_PANLE
MCRGSNSINGGRLPGIAPVAAGLTPWLLRGAPCQTQCGPQVCPASLPTGHECCCEQHSGVSADGAGGGGGGGGGGEGDSLFVPSQNMALYADVSGKQFPVTRGQDVGRYQVSWSLDHKSAHAGTYEVRFFDEESYSLLRKAQRNNEDISVIPPLFTVSVDHRGTWNGPWVSTEVLAAAIGLVIYYLAFSAKSHIQA